MKQQFSEEAKLLFTKKPLAAPEMEKVKSALVKHAKDYLDLNKNKGKNSQINLTDVIINELKVADHNPPFIRDIGRRMERTRDYTMYENKRDDGNEIIVVPLDRSFWEKHSAAFSIGGIFLGALLSALSGILMHRLEQPQYMPKSVEITTQTLSDSITVYQLDIKKDK